MSDNPRAAFARLERVVILGGEPRCQEYAGDKGTIIWRDLVRSFRGSDQQPHWVYIVELSQKEVCRTFLEFEIESQGVFDTEEAHFGKNYEISFDVVVGEDNDFVEGSYRLPGRFWEVLIMSKKEVSEIRYQHLTWDSGITGTVFQIPASAKLDRSFVIEAMESLFGSQEWIFVNGPDSSVLR